MPGDIIMSAIVPHSPRIGIESEAPAFLRGVIDGEYELGQALSRIRPDVIVINSSHWIATFNWYVTCQGFHRGVCVADEAPDLIPAIPYCRTGDPQFGRAIIDAAVVRGLPFHPNDATHFTFDYGTLVPLQYLDPRGVIPVVAIPTCLAATLDECMEVGVAIREAAQATGRRAVFIASSSLSHRLVRVPDQWPCTSSQALDRQFIDMLIEGRVHDAKEWLPAYAQAVNAEVSGRNLATMLGTLDDASALRFAGRQYGSYGQSSGSGNAVVAVSLVQ
jgi:3,4-dihydroxyphenylacetate 2,3-dioxygenase